ncbi:MAG: efflux RND transporter permease subunit [Bacteroidales bacterium]|nr:efflux RND transporter permease subunit [Bacteroidales bacterium]
MSENRVIREFKPTNIALKNKNTIFLLTLLVAVFGILSYRTLPKELFPEVEIPTVLVKTVYPGNPPADMENLVTRPLENEIYTITGIRELRSTSSQDNSDIFIEFETGINIKDALQDVKDAVDRVKGDLPGDLPADPMVLDIDFSEFPIININLSGDFTINELKRFADFLQDRIEDIPEISKVEITGIEEREIQINADPLKLDAYELSFDDIANAISAENISMASGTLRFPDNTRWAVRTIGEFTDVRQLNDIIIKYEDQQIVYLRDVAEIRDAYADATSYARLDDQPVVSLQVVKKAGENLLSATQKIFAILDEARSNESLPEELTVTITNDQSEEIRNQLSNLENSVIMAVILVVLVLYLFLGLKNALFVGIAIPLSMLVSFMVFGLADIQINMIVLFSLILALGLLVDNAIVAVDNIYRFIEKGHSVMDSAKRAIGEIALPIITSTATTLSAFLPLAFWTGITGEFMKYLPLTLIIVLSSSLFVALIIIPVFSYTFFRQEKKGMENPVKPAVSKTKRKLVILGLLFVLSGLFHLTATTLTGNLFLLAALLFGLGHFVLNRIARWFRQYLLPFMENLYINTLRFALRGWKPYIFVASTMGFLILSIVFLSFRSPNILFFPDNEPRFINIMAELPVGTDIDETDRRIRDVERMVEEVIAPYRHIVKSVLTTVGRGAVGEMEMNAGETPHRGLITVTFEEFEFRQGISTNDIMAEISDALVGQYPGIEFRIEKNMAGPPAGRPINIEISGPELDRLMLLADSVKSRIAKSGIGGIEGLKSDLDTDKPEIIIHIDREAARRFGLSTYSIANTIRTALFGLEVSTFKVGEEEYPIQLRLMEEYRHNLAALMNQRITFRSQSTGRLMQVPISAVAHAEFSKTYGAINRIDRNRVVTLSSNVLPGYNANRINRDIMQIMQQMELPSGYSYAFTGEQQEQQESMDFLIRALLIAVSLISLILVTQFNSVYKPFIIIGSVVFSTAGVFFGISLFNMEFIIIMMGVGIVSLAGVVVNNAIVLIDFTDYLFKRKHAELNVTEDEFLAPDVSLDLIEQAGYTRFRPVILTAITTILGLFPLAIGLNINFVSLILDFDPQIYFGGDNARFWGPMSWTVIFGLSVATFLTLVIVPCMYQIILATRRKIHGLRPGSLPW